MKFRGSTPTASATGQHQSNNNFVTDIGEFSGESKVHREANCTAYKSRGKIWLQSYMRRHPNQMAMFLLIGAVLLIASLFQIHALIFEKQGPLDHITDTFIWKPLHARHCPAFSVSDNPNHDNKMKLDNSYVPPLNGILSWDCADITGDSTPFPQIVLAGARSKEENNTWPQWKDLVWNSVDKEDFAHGKGSDGYYVHVAQTHNFPRLQRINTLKASNQYALSGGALRNAKQYTNSKSDEIEMPNQHLCRGMKWEQRLFAVYQSIFSQLLRLNPDDQDFVVVEDDSVMINPQAFIEEVCHARSNEMQFYSLYRSPLQWRDRSSVSCIYEHGTVAFYIRRSTMEKIRDERRRGWFCRFPIDMYISKMGPWYATRREIVGHLDVGRVGSKTG